MFLNLLMWQILSKSHSCDPCLWSATPGPRLHPTLICWSALLPICCVFPHLTISFTDDLWKYSISQEICTRFLLCCALLWLYIDWFMWIHYERLHNHNKAKHNKTVCIFLWIYCILHDDVMAWQSFPRSKGQWCGALMFSLMSASTNYVTSSRVADYLKCYDTHVAAL